VEFYVVNLTGCYDGAQVEIKKAEPRDGSGGNKMGGADPSSAWGPPQAPMGMMQGPNGQMGGPPMNLGAPMGPNMMQSYQGWGTSPQQQSYAGYGTPSGPGSYQGWGAPPAPQGPPPQWGNNYGGPPQQQGYGSYGPSAGSGTSWNSWNMAQNSGSTGPSGKRSVSMTDPRIIDRIRREEFAVAKLDGDSFRISFVVIKMGVK
jgi:RNA-binding protein Musashi